MGSYYSKHQRMKQKDEIFLKNLNNKSFDAFQELYQDYYRSLVVYAIGFVEQRQIAEDIVQDLFISLLEKNITIQSLAGLKAFLYNSVKNKSINHLKHLDIENKYVQHIQDSLKQEVTLESDMEEEEIYRQLFLAIEKLPPRCREIFEMNLDGKRNEEIAEILNLSIETVKTQKKKAMNLLRKHINPNLLLYIYAVILHTK